MILSDQSINKQNLKKAEHIFFLLFKENFQILNAICIYPKDIETVRKNIK